MIPDSMARVQFMGLVCARCEKQFGALLVIGKTDHQDEVAEFLTKNNVIPSCEKCASELSKKGIPEGPILN